MSMAFMREVMAMELPLPTDKTFGKVLQVKQQVAQSLATLAARVQSGMLRPSEDDGMDVVLKAVRDAQNDDLPQLALPPEDEDVDIFA
jgi:hypothetical protein